MIAFAVVSLTLGPGPRLLFYLSCYLRSMFLFVSFPNLFLQSVEVSLQANEVANDQCKLGDSEQDDQDVQPEVNVINSMEE